MNRTFFGLSLQSVRVRLLLWNVGIVALVLATMGSLFSSIVQAKLIASVDDDLKKSLRHGGGPHGPGPPGSPREPPPPPDDRLPDDARHAHFHGPADASETPHSTVGPEGDGPSGGPHGPEFRGSNRRPSLRQLFRSNEFERMPRRFNLQGVALPPFQGLPPWDDGALAESARGAQILKTIDVGGAPARLISRPQWPDPGPPEPGEPPHGPDDRRPLPGDRPIGVVQAVYPLTELNRTVIEMNATLLMLIPIALVFAGAGGAWLTDRALRPVRAITRTAARIGAADLRQRLPLTGGHEFAELSATINGMLERLQAAFGRMEALVEQQRRFTADASHELKTPLTVIKANSSLALATQPEREGYHESMQEIDRAASAMNRLVQDLLVLARADEAQAGLCRTEFSASDLLRAATSASGRASRVVFGPLDETAILTANRDECARIVSNLVENALRHTPADGKITLSCRAGTDSVTLTVADTGAGIASEHLPHLGERFYRVDAARARVDGGSGLGLAICKSLAEANGGLIEFASALGRGTTVTVKLPGHRSPAAW